jgi:hypothetical protein
MAECQDAVSSGAGAFVNASDADRGACSGESGSGESSWMSEAGSASAFLFRADG